ncbi:uncharacterized protein LOC143561998 [Bidens hawaiensis]|uniref:uncharacterized protein LOC143561998 n=1 Tax=Bidens hawaiensis TaxID=980011 RepID=UPI00404B551F
MANTCTKYREFFGVIQWIYSIFANSTKRWAILKDNVKELTLKSMCPTRWESCVDSVKPIRFQLMDLREALLEVRDLNTNIDTKTQSDARSLSKNKVCEFEFYLATVIWYEILSTVNFVSKRLQYKNMILDVAIKQVKKLIKFFKNYREVGFSKAIDEATKIAIEIGVDPVFSQKRPIIRKKQFDELKTLDETKLKSCCYTLQEALKHGDKSDVDAEELYLDLKLFETFLSSDIVTPLDALNNVVQHGVFPNVVNAYRVLLTIPVTVASAERSFSKLKLLKTYMRPQCPKKDLTAWR